MNALYERIKKGGEEMREEYGNLFQKANTMMEESTINPLIIMNCYSFILYNSKLPNRLGPLNKTKKTP